LNEPTDNCRYPLLLLLWRLKEEMSRRTTVDVSLPTGAATARSNVCSSSRHRQSLPSAEANVRE
jgi:hypothetical protein